MGLHDHGVWCAGVRADKAAPEIDFPISDSTVYTVTEGMYGVVNEPGGTGSGSKLPGIELCGKTGSAQVISNQGLARAGKHADLNDNAWFVGFAPRQNPEIVVSVLVQGGQHGATAAAPIARDIVKAYYDKKQGKIPPQQLTTQAVPPGIPPSFAAQAARANKAEPEQARNAKLSGRIEVDNPFTQDLVAHASPSEANEDSD